MNTNAQILFYQFTAATTYLTGVAGIHLYALSISIFSFIVGVVYQLTPRRIGNGLSETMIFEHPAYVQIFKYDDAKPIDQLAAFPMSKISTFIGYAFVNLGNYFAAFLALRTAFLFRQRNRFAQFSLCLGKSLLVLAKECRIRNRFT